MEYRTSERVRLMECLMDLWKFAFLSVRPVNSQLDL